MLSSLDAVAPPKPSLWSAIIGDLQPRHVVTAVVLLALASVLSRFINLAFRRTLERHRQRGTLLPETATQLALTRRLLNVGIWPCG